MFLVSFSFLKSEIADRSFGEKLQICSRLLKSFLYSNWEGAFQKLVVSGNPFYFFSSNHTLEKVISMKNNLKMRFLLSYISFYAKYLNLLVESVERKKKREFFSMQFYLCSWISKKSRNKRISKKSQFVSKTRHLCLEKIACHELIKLKLN